MVPAAVGARGMGLESMRFRAHALGGDITIDSQPGEGTIVSCMVPNRSPMAEAPAA